MKKITGILLAAVLTFSMSATPVRADNASVLEHAMTFSGGATYNIPTETNELKGWPKGPAVMVDSAVVMDADTGTVIYNKGMNEKRFPASTTKIMTVLVALENAELTDTVTFTAEGLAEAVPGNAFLNNPRIQVGETFTMEDCLYAIMLESANEVSTQVAMQIGGSVEGFAELMNKKAEEIGCTNTHFTNANGLHNENHYTTAYEFARIAQEAYKNEEFRKITGTRVYKIPPTNMTSSERQLSNHHGLLNTSEWGYDGCVGGKPGYTDAAQNTLVSYIEKNGNLYIVVTMHYPGVQVVSDTVILMEYVDKFEKIQVSEEAYTKSGGSAIVPKGTTAKDLEIRKTEESGLVKETFSYNGYEVGTALVDEAAKEADEQAALDAQKKAEEELEKEARSVESKENAGRQQDVSFVDSGSGHCHFTWNCYDYNYCKC